MDDYKKYRANDAISNSDLKLINRSIAHYEWAKANPDDDATAAKNFGNMFHCYVLEPEKFKTLYVLLPDDIKPGSSKVYQDFKKDLEAKGQILIKKEELESVKAMGKAVESTKFLRGGVAEESVFGKLTVDGKTIKVKCRPDYRTPMFVIDLKSTTNASQEDFDKSIRNYRYFVQGAFYMDVVLQKYPLTEKFIFIAVESEPPYGVACYELDAAYMEAGRAQYMEDIRKYLKDLEFGRKGYESGVKLLSPPSWFMKKYLKE